MKKYESGIIYHHDKCEVEFKKHGNVVYMKVNDLVIYDNVPVIDPNNFEERSLEQGMSKAYDILVVSPQLITSRDYVTLFGENSIANAKLPSFELLRSLGIKKINLPTGKDYFTDTLLEVKSREYSSYDDVKWFEYDILYTVTHTYNGYKVRGILKSDLG